MTLFAGLDPGKNGAFVILYEDNRYYFFRHRDVGVVEQPGVLDSH